METSKALSILKSMREETRFSISDEERGAIDHAIIYIITNEALRKAEKVSREEAWEPTA